MNKELNMKNIKYLILFLIPVIYFACGRVKEKDISSVFNELGSRDTLINDFIAKVDVISYDQSTNTRLIT
jgi:hypothetical protein